MQKDLEKLSQLDFIKKLKDKKEIIDKNRPLSEDVEDRIFQKLKLDWNFNSNAIEGNTFTYGETVALLMEGITAKGKPLKDALDIKGHNDAIQFMLDMVKGDRGLNESDIRSLHKIILGTQYENPSITASGKIVGKKVSVGTYKTMPNHVLTATGETHYYATPEETPAKMTELVSWFNENANNKEVNPVVLASLFHHRFVAIHPFDDGNGRMTRILTNFILMKFGYPISVIKNEEKKSYYAALSQADRGEVLPFVELMAETIIHSLDIYIKGINGEDINDPNDIDKEIELFRKEIGVKPKIKMNKSEADLDKIMFEMFSFVRPKLKKFIDLFQSISESINITSGAKISLNTNVDFDLKTFKQLTQIKNKNIGDMTYLFFFKNDIFANNFYESGIPGVFNFSQDLRFYNNILWNNFSDEYNDDDMALTSYNYPPADVQHCLVWEGRIDGTDIITDAPLFVDPAPNYGLESNGWEYDWTLRDESPAVNTGTPDTAGLNLPYYDLDGNPRVFGNRIDMGAYENQHIYVKIDNAPISEEIKLYPNPGTSNLYIQIVPEMKDCFFDLYNGKGNIIMHHQIDDVNSVFSTESVPSGVYHYRIYDNNKVLKNSTWIKL